jgi:hypothetical protein
MTQYQPIWTRPENPTRDMSELDMRAYYKAHSVASDCAFALRDGTSTPLDILAVYAALAVDVADRVEKPADRAIVTALRSCWRQWQDGRSYTVPVIAQAVARRVRKAVPACKCQHCGMPIAA